MATDDSDTGSGTTVGGISIEPWAGDRYEYGEIHDVMFRAATKDAERQFGGPQAARVVGREIEGLQVSNDPSEAALLNRLGAVGWMINDTTVKDIALVPTAVSDIVRRERNVNPAKEIIRYRYRMMSRRLP